MAARRGGGGGGGGGYGADPAVVARRTQFLDFLEHNFAGRTYAAQARALQASGQWRLLVSLDDVRAYSAAYAEELLRAPAAVLSAMEEALRVFVSAREELRLRVGITGNFGALHVSPRALTAELLGSLVLVEGIVTKVASVKPRLVRSVHYCEATRSHLTRTYTRSTADDDTAAALPTHDELGNALQFEFGLSQFVDVQRVVVQEMPERAPPGQLPRSVPVTLEHDLVDACKPGDRVRVVGHYRALPATQEREGAQSSSSGVFRTVLSACAVQSVQRALSAEDAQLSADDLRAIKHAATHPRIVTRLARSLAPSIFGHAAVKRALLLQLLGGCERVLANGTHLRGDVNVLMVGDPGTAKSQLLRFVLHVAPLAVSTSGRGSSGVGLTAAVTSDEETGERRLEAGAMVLADRGIVTIDEFDKMSAEDRVAIHEVMEQQTVTIAKAGIHASLNARCAVLAAANPLLGKYDRRRKPAENIALPDSLLSRFDLLFIVLDTLDAHHDRRIAAHVLRMHRHAPPTPATSRTATTASRGSSASSGGIYARSVGDAEAHEAGDTATDADAEGDDADTPRYSLHFLKKYILYARHAVQPTLGTEAARAIVDAFEELRARTQEQRTQPVTPRTLETLIRLSTAHAKARLAREVSLEDTRQARALVTHALYHDAHVHAATAAPAPHEPPTADARTPAPTPTPTPTATATHAPTPMSQTSTGAAAASSGGSAVAAERARFGAQVARVFGDARESVQLARTTLLTRVNALRTEQGEAALSEEAAATLLEALVDEGRLTYVDADAVYL